MRSPGRRAAPRHRAPSVAARWRAGSARLPRGPDDAAPGAGEVRGADRDPPPERARPERARPGRKRISPALRRLVITPTFAAGLGVVVAAFLAANMSRTVLHFSAPIPGSQCTSGGCRIPKPHGGTLASARPGRPHHAQRPRPGWPRHGAPAPAPARRAGRRPRPASGGRPQPSVGQPARSASPTSRSSSGPAASPRRPDHDQRAAAGPGPTPGAWPSAYPGARIAGVQGARWEPGRVGAGVARGWCGLAGGSRAGPRPRCVSQPIGSRAAFCIY